MSRAAVSLAATVLFTGAVAAAGCGVGPGEAAEGSASLTVTRDYGAERMLTATLEGPTPSDTVVRFLDANADIDTDYGDNFVSSIEGVEGSTVDGGAADWFFFVNGVYSELGAGEVEVEVGDRIWWDHRIWSEAYRVPVVVGSYPEPFLHGYPGGSPGAIVECVAAAPGCESVEASLREAGVETGVEEVGEPVAHPGDIRVLVGSWEDLRADSAARLIERGPGESGVYAAIDECTPGDWELEVLGSDAEPRRIVPDGGFVAAVRRGEDAPTFLVAGLEAGGVEDAAAAFTEGALRDRYAVAADSAGEEIAVPAPDSEDLVESGCE